MGHLARCRTLANALAKAGVDCTLVGPGEEFRNAHDEILFRDWIAMDFADQPLEDAENFAALLKRHSGSHAVIDDYRVDEVYQACLAKNGIGWLQFNGRPAQPLWANIILNTSPEANAEDYRKSLRNPDTTLLLGPSYSLIRDEFIAAAGQGGISGARIFVSFGGGDDRGVALRVLRALLEHSGSQVSIVFVTGANNPRNVENLAWIGENGSGRIAAFVEPPNLAGLMANCHIAVLAGGGMTYEANFLGLPMSLVAIADNQILHAAAWEKTGAARYYGALEEIGIERMCADINNQLAGGGAPQRLPAIARRVDGLGGQRVAEAMVREFRL
jgi:UDP-2,4-diacetamido-2,4,6-trideoxy-beta-L-altropyranose hydrolase